MTGALLFAAMQEGGAVSDTHRLAGWVLIGTAILDVGLAFYFAVVRPPPDPRARVILPIAMGMGALLMAGIGVAFLTGRIGG